MCGILFELNRLVPNGMPGGVRGGIYFPLLDWTREKQSGIVKEQMFAFWERSGYGKERKDGVPLSGMWL